MNRHTVTYRTMGSAALKPEFIEPEDQTPIIDFETLVKADFRQRVYRAPRNLSFSEKVSEKLKADPLLGSIGNAFSAPQETSKANKALYVKCVLGISLATLFLIFIGA